MAVALLAFIAADGERLGPFLAETGLGPETLRRAASSPTFLVSLLDYAMRDEDLVLAFAASEGLDPVRIGEARAALGGGERA